MMQYRRTPAVVVLVLVIAGWTIAVLGRGAAGRDAAGLDALQIAVAAP